MEEICWRKDLVGKCRLGEGVGYGVNEYNGICEMLKRGDRGVDKKYIERMER